MKIKEIIERNCCKASDLKKYHGKIDGYFKLLNPKFCIHCGQIWYESSQTDAAGGQETILVEFPMYFR